MVDDDYFRRKRKQEEQERREAEERAAAELKRNADSNKVSDDLLTRVEDIHRRAPILMDQIDNLYRQFISGALSRPPIEERNRLEQMMALVFNVPKPTPADRYRFTSIWSSYVTHKSRWDKILADMESGKIKRFAGAKKGR